MASIPWGCATAYRGHQQIAEVIELLVNEGRAPDDPGYQKVTTKDVDIICAGINHQTWYIQVRYQDEDWTGRLLEGFQKHPKFSQTEKVRIDILRRFGYYSTESNGHLSEYVPWYRKRPEDIRKWVDLSSWIHGETGGYLRVSREARNWFVEEAPKMLEQEPHLHLRYPLERARQLDHRGAGDGPRVPGPLQRGQQRRHQQPAARCHRGGAQVRGRNGINIPAWGPAPGTGGDM